MDSYEERLEFPLILYPNEKEEADLRIIIPTFMVYFNTKNPYLAIIKALQWAYKALCALQKGKGYYYGLKDE